VAKKNNLKPKAYAKNNIDRWSHLTGYELSSLKEYTRDQLRGIASRYGIKNASRLSGDEVIKQIQNSEDYKKAGEEQTKLTIFEKVKKATGGEAKSTEWYKRTLKTLSKDITTEPARMTQEQKMDSVQALVHQDQNVLRRRVFPGHLYFFEYKAETESLPYYDKYPLVYVFKVSGSEFYGANLHYINYKKRQIVIEKLQKDLIDIPKKIIHKYLNKRCKSLFIDLAKDEWVTSIFLPVEDFVLMKGGGRIEYPKEMVWEEMDQYWNDRIKGTKINKG
jgi:hypothetical protein